MKKLLTVFSIMIIMSGGTAHAAEFTNESVQGTYAYKVTLGDNDAVALGVITYDGNGNATNGSGIINMPAPLWRRKAIATTVEGTYEMNTDGTATATYIFTTTDGLTLEIDYDAVIMQVQDINGLKVATEIFAVQKEPGNPLLLGKPGKLVTGELKRLSD